MKLPIPLILLFLLLCTAAPLMAEPHRVHNLETKVSELQGQLKAEAAKREGVKDELILVQENYNRLSAHVEKYLVVYNAIGALILFLFILLGLLKLKFRNEKPASRDLIPETKVYNDDFERGIKQSVRQLQLDNQQLQEQLDRQAQIEAPQATQISQGTQPYNDDFELDTKQALIKLQQENKQLNEQLGLLAQESRQMPQEIAPEGLQISHETALLELNKFTFIKERASRVMVGQQVNPSTQSQADLAAWDEFLQEIPPFKRTAEDWLSLANLQLENRLFHDAITSFTKVLEFNPNHLTALFHRAFAHGEAGRPAQSLADYASYLELHPHHADAHNNRAYQYLKQGDTKNARLSFKEALDQGSGFVSATNLVELSLLENLPAHAKKDWEKAQYYKPQPLQKLIPPFFNTLFEVLEGKSNAQEGLQQSLSKQRDQPLNWNWDELTSWLDMKTLPEDQEAQIREMIQMMTEHQAWVNQQQTS